MKKELTNIWKLNINRFFHNLIPAYVIERLFWEQRGMTIQKVVYTEIVYAVTVILLEIPTGIIADRWGRKRMMMLNAWLGCCELLILLFATKLWHFAAAVFLAGIGRSASSGSENALLYDSLRLNGREQSFEKYLGRLNAYDFMAAVLAALAGSTLASRFGFELNYWISFGSMVISLGVSSLLIEPDIKTQFDSSPLIKDYLRFSLVFFVSNPRVSLVLLSGMVMGAALNFIDEFWQLYINHLGIPVLYFGVFSATLMALRLPGSVFAYTVKKWFSYRMLFLGITAVYGIGFLYLSFIRGYTSLLAIFILCLLAGVIEPIAAGYLHHRIDSAMRATLDSFQSLGLRAVTIIMGLGFGYFSAKYDLFGGYRFIAVICTAFFLYFLLMSKKVLLDE